MESSVVKSSSNPNIELVKNYFNENFPSYSVIEEFFQGPYWGIKYSNKEVDINISGDIGFAVEIFIDSSKYNLWQYDRSVNDFMKTTKQNISYQLNVLKSFLINDV